MSWCRCKLRKQNRHQIFLIRQIFGVSPASSGCSPHKIKSCRVHPNQYILDDVDSSWLDSQGPALPHGDLQPRQQPIPQKVGVITSIAEITSTGACAHMVEKDIQSTSSIFIYAWRIQLRTTNETATCRPNMDAQVSGKHDWHWFPEKSIMWHHGTRFRGTNCTSTGRGNFI